MAIVACPECGKQVSDTAPACPSCGAPVAQVLSQKRGTQSPPSQPAPQVKANPSTRPWAWVAAGMLIALGVVVFVFSRSDERKAEAAARVEQSKPDLPIALTYRGAITGPGLVISLKNNSNRSLAVLMTVANATTKQVKTFRLDISPQQTTEVGYLEGWTFASGDSVKVVHAEYKPLLRKLP